MAKARAEGMLLSQLGPLLADHGPRVLVVKATTDEAFAEVLSVLLRTRPDIKVTSLVSGDAPGVEEEVGEVIRAGIGRRALLRRLASGYDVCIIAADPRHYGGVRRLLADVAAAASHARLKIVCSPHQVLATHDRGAALLAPFASAVTLALGLTGAVLMAAIAFLLATLATLIGEGVLRVVGRGRG